MNHDGGAGHCEGCGHVKENPPGCCCSWSELEHWSFAQEPETGPPPAEVGNTVSHSVYQPVCK